MRLALIWSHNFLTQTADLRCNMVCSLCVCVNFMVWWQGGENILDIDWFIFLCGENTLFCWPCFSAGIPDCFSKGRSCWSLTVGNTLPMDKNPHTTTLWTIPLKGNFLDLNLPFQTVICTFFEQCNITTVSVGQILLFFCLCLCLYVVYWIFNSRVHEYRVNNAFWNLAYVTYRNK